MPNIAYVCQGEGDVVLFLHGWGQNKESMLPLIEELKYKFKCVVIDLPGFGQSTFNSEKNLNEYTATIRKFLLENNLVPSYIVGHSFGGKVAFNYYLNYKDVKGLVIIASPLVKPKRTIKYYYNIYLYKLKKKLHFKTNKKGSEDYKNCPSEMKKFFVNVVNTHFDRDISNVNLPILFLWGNKDKKVPIKKAKKLNKKIFKSELVIEKGGHFAYLENIDFTRLIIQKFLRR